MKRQWQRDELEYLERNFPSTQTAVIAEHLNRSYSSVSQAALIMGIKKTKEFLASEASGRMKRNDHRGRLHQFKKGQLPANKGKRQAEYMHQEAIERTKATRFPKGHLPHNAKSDKAISIRKDKTGIEYRFIRVSLCKWVPLHRYNWEKLNGRIPKGMKLIFRDRDTTNCDINNLELVTPAELMRRNSVHNLPKPIAQLVQLRGALNRQINKHIKKLTDEK